MYNVITWYDLDENNNPVPAKSPPGKIGTTEWRVAKTNILGAKISTVFLGLDHSFGDKQPILWETMIFGGWLDEYQERYTSHDDAVLGHARAVRKAIIYWPLRWVPIGWKRWLQRVWWRIERRWRDV